MPKGPSSQKVEVVPLFFKKQLQTDASTSYSYIDLDLPQAAEWGPYLDSIVAYTATENRTAQFQWKIAFYWSLDDRRWNGPVDLFSAIQANGDVIQTAYSTTTTFGLRMRYVIGVANISGTSIERGVCTCALSFIFKS